MRLFQLKNVGGNRFENPSCYEFLTDDWKVDFPEEMLGTHLKVPAAFSGSERVFRAWDKAGFNIFWNGEFNIYYFVER